VLRVHRNSLWFAASLVLLLCNLLDALFTVAAVQGGYATEANPLMGALLERDPLVFVLVKHFVVSLGLMVLWRMRWHKLARIGLWAAAPGYSILLLYHVMMASAPFAE
jgi:hypothetical protein